MNRRQKLIKQTSKQELQDAVLILQFEQLFSSIRNVIIKCNAVKVKLWSFSALNAMHVDHDVLYFCNIPLWEHY